MVAAAVASVVGLIVDPRVIAGAPAWLKPLKFAIATATYSLTLAWIFGFLAEWPRVRRGVGWTTAIVFVLEVAIIDAQAWRGTTSPAQRRRLQLPLRHSILRTADPGEQSHGSPGGDPEPETQASTTASPTVPHS